MRPEHLRDMLRCGRRPLTARLYQALHSLLDLAERGRLPAAAASVLLRTRLVFLRKKNSETPRPIRIGEVWR
eukprot:10888098-Prorocentrum_lima.AAC.1